MTKLPYEFELLFDVEDRGVYPVRVRRNERLSVGMKKAIARAYANLSNVSVLVDGMSISENKRVCTLGLKPGMTVQVMEVKNAAF